MRAFFMLAAAWLAGCGSGTPPAAGPTQPRELISIRPVPAPKPTLLQPRGFRPPLHLELPAWQPGFNQALRWEVDLAHRTTYRIRVRVGRAGTHLRLAFRTGDGPARLHRATAALAATDGVLASEAMELTFDGAPGFSTESRQRILSDSIRFPVAFGQELYITLEAEGHLAAGAIDLFPDSWADTGVAADAAVVAGWHEQRAIGLATVFVFGPPTRSFVALGDSITEAFVSGRDDYRNAWPQVAEELTGLPLANAGVSGQGLWAANETVHDEILVLQGITDCIVLLGTNDLGASDETQLRGRLEQLFDTLDPFCSVWAGTLVPKERPDFGAELRHLRHSINEWLRQDARVAGVIDFEAVLGRPGEPDRWLPGLDEDGVHPSVAGQRVMGEEAARFIVEEILGGDGG